MIHRLGEILYKLLGNDLFMKVFTKYYRILSIVCYGDEFEYLESNGSAYGPFHKFSYEQAYAAIFDIAPKLGTKKVFIIGWSEISKQDYDFLEKRNGQ